MPSITLYSQTEKLAPVTNAKQQMVSGGFGEGIGESISRSGGALADFAKAKDAYNARVEEAGVMELDARFSERVREVEQGFLNSRGRNAVDGEADADQRWDEIAEEFAGATSSPRQREMMEAQLARRRERWGGQRADHVSRQNEVWQTGVEDGSLASLGRETVSFALGSTERTDSYLQVGARLDDIARRRGWSAEERKQRGFDTFSTIHVATVERLRDENAPMALQYLEENRDAIDPGVLPQLLDGTRVDAWTDDAKREASGEFANTEPEVDVGDGGDGTAPRRVQVLSPVPHSVNSRFGVRRGRGTHGGTDFLAPANTPFRPILPGVARVRNQPGLAGRYIEIDHGNGLVSQYMHLNAANVQDGQRVTEGQIIGLTGGVAGSDGAGNSDGPHLHVTVLRNGVRIDPESLIGGEVDGTGGSAPRRRPTSFTTVEDVQEWAEARSGGDWRKREIYEREGMAQLQRVRGQRADNESEGDRAANEWRAANPGASWSSAPVSIRSSASPGYRAREAEQENNTRLAAEGQAAASRAVGDTVFIDLLDIAATNPQEFLRRNPDDVRGLITPSQYQTLRQRRTAIRTSDGATRNIDLVRPEMRQALDTAGFEIDPAKMDPEDARAAADLAEYVETYAARHQAQTGAPPTVADLRGVYRTGLARLSTSDGRQVIAASARNAGILPSSAPTGPARRGVAPPVRIEGFAIPRNHQRWLERRFRSEGVPNPTRRQLENAYAAALRAGQLPE